MQRNVIVSCVFCSMWPFDVFYHNVIMSTTKITQVVLLGMKQIMPVFKLGFRYLCLQKTVWSTEQIWVG